MVGMFLKALGYVFLVLVLAILAYRFFRKTPQNYYGKAARAHRKGEQYYGMGDYQLAEDYYEEADAYRQEA